MLEAKRFSDGYAEKHVALNQKARLSLKMDLSTHTHQAMFPHLCTNNCLVTSFPFKFQTLNGRNIDYIIELAAAVTVVFSPECELLVCGCQKTSSPCSPLTKSDYGQLSH